MPMKMENGNGNGKQSVLISGQLKETGRSKHTLSVGQLVRVRAKAVAIVLYASLIYLSIRQKYEASERINYTINAIYFGPRISLL